MYTIVTHQSVQFHIQQRNCLLQFLCKKTLNYPPPKAHTHTNLIVSQDNAKLDIV